MIARSQTTKKLLRISNHFHILSHLIINRNKLHTSNCKVNFECWRADKCEKKHIWREAKKTTTNKTREPIYKYYEIFSLKSIIHLNFSRLDKNRIICSWIDWTWVVYSALNFFLSANLQIGQRYDIDTLFNIYQIYRIFEEKKEPKCLFLIFCLSVCVSIELYHWKFWAKEFERIWK